MNNEVPRGMETETRLTKVKEATLHFSTHAIVNMNGFTVRQSVQCSARCYLDSDRPLVMSSVAGSSCTTSNTIEILSIARTRAQGRLFIPLHNSVPILMITRRMSA